MNHAIEKILSRTFYDYSTNNASETEVAQFRKLVQDRYSTVLDKEYLDFLQLLNGFELNGLNFYGTNEKKEIFVLSSIVHNDFWRSELTALKDFYILGDGDIDFYCFSDTNGLYSVLDKGGLRVVKECEYFSELIDYILSVYVESEG